MAKTVVIYAGGKTEYQFPFDYLRKEFVKVSLVAANGTPTDKVYGSDYTVTDRKITLKVASDATGEVRIWRSTTTNPITVFSDASVLRARTLNALDTQLLHIAEENLDDISMYGMSLDKADNTWKGMGRIIKNVKNPLNPQDAVTLNYLDSVGVARATQMEALAAQITADKSNSEVAAAAALVSEKNAKTSETNAKVSEMASKKVRQTLRSLRRLQRLVRQMQRVAPQQRPQVRRRRLYLIVRYMRHWLLLHLPALPQDQRNHNSMQVQNWPQRPLFNGH